MLIAFLGVIALSWIVLLLLRVVMGMRMRMRWMRDRWIQIWCKGHARNTSQGPDGTLSFLDPSPNLHCF
jgi:hypothetical protein